MLNPSPAQWTLKAGHDRRFKSGHPWVYSNELVESPKGVEPGQEVILRAPGGDVLATGYGNPSSLISFRTMSRGPKLQDSVFARARLMERIETAWKLRLRLGYAAVSCRLVFGESDGFPGLIIDRYLSVSGIQCLVLQPQTAGMAARIDDIVGALQASDTFKDAAIILRSDSGMLKIEGIEKQDSQILAPHPRATESFLRKGPWITGRVSRVALEADLLSGQKTGLFLDQVDNQERVMELIAGWAADRSHIRVLDLCSYVGAWSARISAKLTSLGKLGEFTLVDSSASALEASKANVKGAKTLKRDVLHELKDLASGSFDLVIVDPPALIKNRKSVGPGKHAYLQLNTEAVRLNAKEGMIVSCSCSALLEAQDFQAALAKAATRNNRNIAWVAEGSQSADHPWLAEFPEGRYLKAWVGIERN